MPDKFRMDIRPVDDPPGTLRYELQRKLNNMAPGTTLAPDMYYSRPDPAGRLVEDIPAAQGATVEDLDTVSMKSVFDDLPPPKQEMKSVFDDMPPPVRAKPPAAEDASHRPGTYPDGTGEAFMMEGLPSIGPKEVAKGTIRSAYELGMWIPRTAGSIAAASAGRSGAFEGYPGVEPKDLGTPEEREALQQYFEEKYQGAITAGKDIASFSMETEDLGAQMVEETLGLPFRALGYLPEKLGEWTYEKTGDKLWAELASLGLFLGIFKGLHGAARYTKASMLLNKAKEAAARDDLAVFEESKERVMEEVERVTPPPPTPKPTEAPPEGPTPPKTGPWIGEGRPPYKSERPTTGIPAGWVAVDDWRSITPGDIVRTTDPMKQGLLEVIRGDEKGNPVLSGPGEKRDAARYVAPEGVEILRPASPEIGEKAKADYTKQLGDMQRRRDESGKAKGAKITDEPAGPPRGIRQFPSLAADAWVERFSFGRPPGWKIPGSKANKISLFRRLNDHLRGKGINLEETGPGGWSELTQDQVIDFAASVGRKTTKGQRTVFRSIRDTLADLNRFKPPIVEKMPDIDWKYLMEEYVPKTEQITRRKAATLPEIRSAITNLHEVVRRALRGEGRKTPVEAARDRALFEFFVNVAPRTSELQGLRLQDLVLEGDNPSVKFIQKGGRERVAPLMPETVAALKEYLRQRGIDPASRPLAKVFTGTGKEVIKKGPNAGQLSPYWINHTWIPEYLSKFFGEKKAFTIHNFRTTLRTALVNAGIPGDMVNHIVGHAGGEKVGVGGKHYYDPYLMREYLKKHPRNEMPFFEAEPGPISGPPAPPAGGGPESGLEIPEAGSKDAFTPQAIHPPGRDLVGPSDVVRFIRSKFHQMVIYMSTGRKAAGLYHPFEGTVKQKQANRIRVTAHEVAHALHKALFPDTVTVKGLTPPVEWNNWAQGLESIATIPARGQSPLIEGWAELVHRWLTNKSQPDGSFRIPFDPNGGVPQRQLFEAYEYLETKMREKSPDLLSYMMHLRKMIDIMENKQSSRSKLMSRIVFTRAAGGKTYPKDPLRVRVGQAFNWFMQSWVDQFRMVSVIQKEFLRQGGEVEPGFDPITTFRLLLGNSGEVNHWYLERNLRNRGLDYQFFRPRSFLTGKNYEFEGRKVLNLMEILEQIPESKHADWETYLVSSAGEERMRVKATKRLMRRVAVDPQGNLVLVKRGKLPDYEVGMPRGELLKIKKEYEAGPDGALFKKTALQFHDWLRASLSYAAEAGFIKKHVASQLMNDFKNYVPLERDVRERLGLPWVYTKVASRKAGGGLEVKSEVVKRTSMAGSFEDILSPVETSLSNLSILISAARRNAANRSFIHMITKGKTQVPGQPVGMKDYGKYVVELKPDKLPFTVRAEDMKKALTNMGVGDAIGVDISQIPIEAFADKTFWHTKPGKPRGPLGDKGMVLRIFDEHANQKFYLITDPGLYSMYSKAMHFSPREFSWALKAAEVPAMTLRLGSTLHPDFMSRNWFRDQITAFIFNRYGVYIPFVDAFRGASAMLPGIRKIPGFAVPQEFYADWIGKGGLKSTLYTFDRYGPRNQIQLIMRQSVPKGMWYAAGHPYESARLLLDYVQSAGDVIENSTRLGVAYRNYRHLVEKKKMPKENAMRIAIFHGRDNMPDFGQAGTMGRVLNRVTAFFNANMRGIDKLAREAVESPRTLWPKVFIGITLPSIMTALYMNDDPGYRELPWYWKDLFYCIGGPGRRTALLDWQEKNGPYKDWTPDMKARFEEKYPMYRLPLKPFEAGLLFGSLYERITNWILDVYKEKEPSEIGGTRFLDQFHKQMEDYYYNVKEMMAPDLIPSGATPMFESWFNESQFTQRTIVPKFAERFPNVNQYMPYTTETAKFLSKQFDRFYHPMQRRGAKKTWAEKILPLNSPAMLEHYFRGYGGSIGHSILKLSDIIIKKTLQEPFIRSEEKRLGTSWESMSAAQKFEVKERYFETHGGLNLRIDPTPTNNDKFLIKAFSLRFPTANSQSIIRFYDRLEAYQGVAAAFKAGYEREFAPEQARAQMKQLLEERRTWQLAAGDTSGGAGKELAQLAEEMGAAAKAVYGISYDPIMTPDEKMRSRDVLYFEMIEIAQKANKMMDAMREEEGKRSDAEIEELKKKVSR